MKSGQLPRLGAHRAHLANPDRTPIGEVASDVVPILCQATSSALPSVVLWPCTEPWGTDSFYTCWSSSPLQPVARFPCWASWVACFCPSQSSFLRCRPCPLSLSISGHTVSRCHPVDIDAGHPGFTLPSVMTGATSFPGNGERE